MECIHTLVLLGHSTLSRLTWLWSKEKQQNFSTNQSMFSHFNSCLYYWGLLKASCHHEMLQIYTTDWIYGSMSCTMCFNLIVFNSSYYLCMWLPTYLRTLYILGLLFCRLYWFKTFMEGKLVNLSQTFTCCSHFCETLKIKPSKF